MPTEGQTRAPDDETTDPFAGPLPKTLAEWRGRLTAEQFQITRMKGTERAFTGKYWKTETPGTYKCVCCGEPLFTSGDKFTSECGWPAFSAPIDKKANGKVAETPDITFGMRRVEVTCRKCAPTSAMSSTTALRRPESATASIRHRSSSTRRSQGGRRDWAPRHRAKSRGSDAGHRSCRGRPGLSGLQLCWPRSQARSPFWTCIRLAACSTTTLQLPSITSSVTSSPRRAGRQCMKRASGQWAHEPALT